MAGRFAVGVVVGGLAALTPFLYPAVLVIGLGMLFSYGLEAPGDGASAGVLWVCAWTAVLSVVLAAVLALIVGLWAFPRATLTAAGTLLVLAAVHRHMTAKRGDSNGSS